jgi:hypothetical protein
MDNGLRQSFSEIRGSSAQGKTEKAIQPSLADSL